MMAPLAHPRRAQRQEVAQGGDEIAPTVDVGVVGEIADVCAYGETSGSMRLLSCL